MSKVGKRNGLLICVLDEPPKFPSWKCRFIGHNWGWRADYRSGVTHAEWMTCGRCGAHQSWYHFEHLPSWYDREEIAT